MATHAHVICRDDITTQKEGKLTCHRFRRLSLLTSFPWLHALSCLVFQLAAFTVRVKPDAAAFVPSRRVKLVQRLGVLAACAQLDACKASKKR